MVSRWPYRPETLVARFERAVRAHAALTTDAPTEAWFRASRNIMLARRDLLARITPATAFQARRDPPFEE